MKSVIDGDSFFAGVCLLFFDVCFAVFCRLSASLGRFDSLPSVLRECGGLAPLAGARRSLLSSHCRARPPSNVEAEAPLPPQPA